MSLENTIERIASALEEIAKRLNNVEQYPLDLGASTKKPEVPQPVVTPGPAATPPPPPQPTGPQAPFSTQAELNNYVMESYSAMGPAKGANIQGLLAELGFQKVTDIPVEKYALFYQKMEELKSE